MSRPRPRRRKYNRSPALDSTCEATPTVRLVGWWGSVGARGRCQRQRPGPWRHRSRSAGTNSSTWTSRGAVSTGGPGSPWSYADAVTSTSPRASQTCSVVADPNTPNRAGSSTSAGPSSSMTDGSPAGSSISTSSTAPIAHPQPHAAGELVDGDPIPSVHGGGRPELGLRVTGRQSGGHAAPCVPSPRSRRVEGSHQCTGMRSRVPRAIGVLGGPGGMRFARSSASWEMPFCPATCPRVSSVVARRYRTPGTVRRSPAAKR